ncbi:aminotransferase class I/II-fold pyridoxal phosphate-dependent enzyme [Paenibacillus chartarius]|uniref:Aminotransferase class I/II-fold pyridoxal phosphate-dependent enzyme n=1 Tax=Paenibacillus chartarius TaxID=747481 RepID=A0ABV6DU22_9BACL
MTLANEARAPLFEALVRHAEAGHASFHVPGHKSGQAVREAGFAGGAGGSPGADRLDREDGDWLEAERRYYDALLRLDLTEITGLDDLHQPEGAIREAEELAAECFGAARTFFLVGGSTVGNQAMILSVCGRDELLLVQRNVHKSVLHGLMLAGARAVFLPPKLDPLTGIAGGVEIADVRAALDKYPEARGLLVTNPNYYGMAADLRELAELLHAYGKPLLVDEAHGAHFGFHPELPPSALACGADLVVQSTHKMLTAMTMGAMLHVGRADSGMVGSGGHHGPVSERELRRTGAANADSAAGEVVTASVPVKPSPRVDVAAVARLLAMLQSSSPSYPILASLDLARRRVHTAAGRAQLARGLAAAQSARRWLREQPWYGSLAEEGASPPGRGDALDPFKVTVWDATGTLNGYALQRELERLGCFAELATPEHALLAFGPASTAEDAARLCAALDAVARRHGLPDRPLRGPGARPLPFPAAASAEPVRFAVTGPAAGGSVRRVPLHAAAGHVAAAMVVPYPPGIPVLYPGERITPGTAAYLQQLAEQGARFHGTPSGKLTELDIISTDEGT